MTDGKNVAERRDAVFSACSVSKHQNLILNERDAETILRLTAPERNDWCDWGCIECAPGSDILKPGFRCLRHRVMAWLKQLAGKTENDSAS